MVLGPQPGAYIIVLSTNGFGMVTNLDSRWAGQVAVARQKWGWRKLAGLVMGIVFTGDSGESNPRLWSDETSGSNPNRGASIGRKNIDHSVTNRRGLSFRQTFSQKTLGFCTIRVGSLVENSGTRTTFLLRSPKTEKEQPLIH